MIDLQVLAVEFTIGIWVAWAAIWLLLSRRVKAAARHESWASRLAHLAPLGVATLLLVLPLRFGLSAPLLPRVPALVFAGAALTLCGIVFCVRARLVLAGNWSGTVQVKHGHELVRHGAYAIVRHPIYTGLLLALLGTALEIDAWRGIIAWVIVWLSFERKRRTEEAFMRGNFGAAYDAYAATTPALVPFTRPFHFRRP